MINNFLLQKSVCLCEQIAKMRPCFLCGRTEYPPEIEAEINTEKENAERQRQAFSEKYDPEHNDGKLPF